jgi:hypothetical protein
MPCQHANDPHGGVERGERGEAGGKEQPHPRRDREPRGYVLQQHAWRGKRVQSQESRAGQQRHRDEEGPGVVASGGGLAGNYAERDVHRSHREHQPKVRRMVLPMQVEVRFRQQ